VALVSDLEFVYPVEIDEVVPWMAAMMTTFLGDAAESRVWAEWRRDHGWSTERAWGVKDRDRWIATLRTLATTLTVPGGAEVPADALTNVTVAATHRRRGLLRSMLSSSLAAAHDRGDAVSVLLAAEYPIYGRFGYAPATTGAYYTLFPRRRGGGLRAGVEQRVRQVDSEEYRALAPRVFAMARRIRAGNIDRTPDRWDSMLSTNGYPEPLKPMPTFLVYDGAEQVEGFLSWVPQGPDWDDTQVGGEVKVLELWAATDAAYVGLWQYLLNLDVVEKIHIRTRPTDEALRWLMIDARALQQTYAGDHLWLRLLDIPSALSARTYSTDDRLVLDVVDNDTGGYGAGRFELDARGCVPVSAEGQLRVHQRALASVYLGGFTFSQLRISGLVEELVPGALQRADAMFATAVQPWCGTDF
jgi:predicted acetyltransferase